MVAKAPPFGDIAGSLEAYIGAAILIGYAIGYDLAVPERREYSLAARATRASAPHARTPTRLAAPSLADYSLEALCEWLEVKISGRHTALGDARAAGEVFLALDPAPAREEHPHARRSRGGEPGAWQSAMPAAPSATCQQRRRRWTRRRCRRASTASPTGIACATS